MLNCDRSIESYLFIMPYYKTVLTFENTTVNSNESFQSSTFLWICLSVVVVVVVALFVS